MQLCKYNNPLTDICSQKVVSTPPRAPRHTRRLFLLTRKNITYENDRNNKIQKRMHVTPLIRMIWARLDSNDTQFTHNKNQWVPDTNISMILPKNQEETKPCCSCYNTTTVTSLVLQ